MGNNVKSENTGVQNKVIIFESIQELYEDLLLNQSFMLSQNTYNGNKTILEGCTIYRYVELKRGKLYFHGNKYGGSELAIKGSLLSIKKMGNPDTHMSEYRLKIDGLNEPFVFLALKKNHHLADSLNTTNFNL